MKFQPTAVLIICLGMFFGCQSVDTDSAKDSEEIRIVSLSPGISQTLVDLGYSDNIVGRSAFCTAIPLTVPVVGDLLGVDYERLRKLHPSHVFVQKTESQIDQHLVNLSQSGAFALQSWKLDRLEDIKELVLGLSTQLGDSPEELAIILEGEKQIPSPVLIVTQGTAGSVGLCFGVDTYLDDILNLMDSQNALLQSGWRTLSLEDIVSLQPACILVVSDSIIYEESIKGIRSLGIPVIPFVHKHALIPSSQISTVAHALQESMQSE